MVNNTTDTSTAFQEGQKLTSFGGVLKKQDVRTKQFTALSTILALTLPQKHQ
jgi:hypothetical protein